jgi:hypothetical protein
MDSVSTTLSKPNASPASHPSGPPASPPAEGLTKSDGDPPSPGRRLTLISPAESAGTTRLAKSAPDALIEGLGDELGEGVGLLAGMGIALLTLIVPLASVVVDRADAPAASLLTLPPTASARDESPQPASFASPRTGESPGGNPGRKP